mmetsp:Transcript_51235/g.122781  ORF Transcript_51235/g.122781 Transcript_51235/m.122781 type:complete len:220 (+) Transcript_51235:292-951(+)
MWEAQRGAPVHGGHVAGHGRPGIASHGGLLWFHLGYGGAGAYALAAGIAGALRRRRAGAHRILLRGVRPSKQDPEQHGLPPLGGRAGLPAGEPGGGRLGSAAGARGHDDMGLAVAVSPVAGARSRLSLGPLSPHGVRGLRGARRGGADGGTAVQVFAPPRLGTVRRLFGSDTHGSELFLGALVHVLLEVPWHGPHGSAAGGMHLHRHGDDLLGFPANAE